MQLFLLHEGDYKILYCGEAKDFAGCRGTYTEIQHAKHDPNSTYQETHTSHCTRTEWAGEPGDSIPTNIPYCLLPKTLTADEAIALLHDYEWSQDAAETMLANLQPGEHTIPDESWAGCVRLTRLT